MGFMQRQRELKHGKHDHITTRERRRRAVWSTVREEAGRGRTSACDARFKVCCGPMREIPGLSARRKCNSNASTPVKKWLGSARGHV
jgi:hypothetical protein